MTNYREVLRLAEMSFSQKQIAESVGVTRQTVSTIIRRAEALGLRFSNVSELSDRELTQKLMPQGKAAELTFKMPDYEVVHRELQKPGVTLMLMWQEYVLKCHTGGELRIRKRNSANTITIGQQKQKRQCTSTESPAS
jgi:transcriptional regulator